MPIKQLFIHSFFEDCICYITQAGPGGGGEGGGGREVPALI